MDFAKTKDVVGDVLSLTGIGAHAVVVRLARRYFKYQLPGS